MRETRARSTRASGGCPDSGCLRAAAAQIVAVPAQLTPCEVGLLDADTNKTLSDAQRYPPGDHGTGNDSAQADLFGAVFGLRLGIFVTSFGRELFNQPLT